MATPIRFEKRGPLAPISCAEGFGGPGRRLTSPPSWSTLTRSGSLDGLGIACSSRVSLRTDLRPPTFSSKRITPEISPVEIIRRRPAEGWWPEKPVITRAPASSSSVIPVTGGEPATSMSAAAARAPNIA